MAKQLNRKKKKIDETSEKERLSLRKMPQITPHLTLQQQVTSVTCDLLCVKV